MNIDKLEKANKLNQEIKNLSEDKANIDSLRTTKTTIRNGYVSIQITGRVKEEILNILEKELNRKIYEKESEFKKL